jgi:hypothetical protein
MAFSGMLRRMALVRTVVSEELSASIIMVIRIGELGTLAETSVLTRDIQRNIPEDAILHSHRCENLKSSIFKVENQPNKKPACSRRLERCLGDTFLPNDCTDNTTWRRIAEDCNNDN